MKVGFIGLGRMGSGMAGRILSGGHELAIFDAVAAQMAPLVSAGARAASSVAELCVGRDVVITMLVEMRR
jgi:3-hydroxyisobutyrate dehydrogenase